VPNKLGQLKPEKAVLQSLQEGSPKSIKEIAKALSEQSPNSERLAKDGRLEASRRRKGSL
jgi:hypothetical protein